MKTSKLLFLLASLTFICSCNNDDESAPNTNPIIDPIIVSTGMYVVNEGNFYAGIDGSLSYLDYASNNLSNKVFQQINGKSLGGTPDDGIIFKNMLVIPATDEKIVWFIDAQTFKIIEQLSLSFQPRYVTAGMDCVYISTYNGRVISYNPDTKETKTSDVIGACLEDIVFLNDFIYVCNSFNPDYTYNTNVVKLKASDLSKVADINVVCNPTQIETDGNVVYVLSSGDYYNITPIIQLIDANDNVKKICSGCSFTIGNGMLFYYVASDALNLSSGISYKALNLTTAEEYEFIDGKDIEYPDRIAFDSYNNFIYFSSFHLSEYGYGDYNSPGYIVKYDMNGKKLDSYNVGAGPKTMIFKTSYQ
ncbi:MAG: hypothetical protein MJZ20_03160 [Bacteroidaceae bacterium]|nr:hypothetical protein [Bacteroidaceae bacterium]